MLRSGLTECIKWGVPVYTHAGKNVVMVHALKDFAFINFFKGALLADPHRVLLQVGNQQSDRSIRFTHPDQIEPVAEVISQYVQEAIELETQVFDPKNPDQPILIDEIEEVGVSVNNDKVVIRTIADIEDMTYGIGNSYTFKQGVKYSVPRDLAQYLESLGYIWRQ
jgi:hypothetical protein